MMNDMMTITFPTIVTSDVEPASRLNTTSYRHRQTDTNRHTNNQYTILTHKKLSRGRETARLHILCRNVVDLYISPYVTSPKSKP